MRQSLNKPLVSVIIPTYNNAGTLSLMGGVLEEKWNESSGPGGSSTWDVSLGVSGTEISIDVTGSQTVEWKSTYRLLAGP